MALSAKGDKPSSNAEIVRNATLSSLPQHELEAPSAYAARRPFPHGVYDGLFPEAVLHAVDREIVDDVLARYPDAITACKALRAQGWTCKLSKLGIDGHHYGGHLKVSLRSKMGVATAGFVAALKSHQFVALLENLTKIAPLQPDPKNFGAGIHQIFSNGCACRRCFPVLWREFGYENHPRRSLQIHADFNKHPRPPLGAFVHRRVNVFVYPNDDWDEAWGGDLELWNRQMTSCDARIAPLLGRLVVFSTTDFSYHGHADPLLTPLHRSRRSIAQYYYSTMPQREEDRIKVKTHSTLYQTRLCESCRTPVCHGQPH